MPDSLHRKFAELEHRLLAGHEQIGRGVGVPFLLLLYPPSEELRVRRDVGSLVAKLRAEGRPVEVIDCNQVLLDYLHHTAELQRAIRAEKRNPGALREFGIGEVLAEALGERVITAQQRMSGPGVVVLTRMGALHPFLLPNIVQERLAGRRCTCPPCFWCRPRMTAGVITSSWELKRRAAIGVRISSTAYRNYPASLAG